MAPRRLAWLGLGLALSLSAPARADEPPDPPAVAAKPAQNKPFMSRPLVVGLLAALFLIVAGAAGANDKHGKKPD